MKLAILFWFYKEPEICKNRLEILRRYNPTTPIYGLYGGELASEHKFQSFCSQYLDDFYIFSENKDSYWKWIQGDLMITHWYRDRGKDLEWDSIIVVQWDMLVFGAVEELFSMLKQDQILLSGLRPVAEVENDWQWVSPKFPDLRKKYTEFLEYVYENHAYNQNPLGCLFIVVVFPRIFLKQYSRVKEAELGFLEYRVPIYSQIFGIPFCKNHSFNAWWVDLDKSFWTKNLFKRVWNYISLKFNSNSLNPAKREISLISIFCQLNTKFGSKIFHPYEKIFPTNQQQWFKSLFDELIRDLSWLSHKIFKQRSS
jgi:hypothetical protein